MRRTQFQTLLTSLLLIAFIADASDALSLFAPHCVAAHEVGAHTKKTLDSTHDEFVKRPSHEHLIKFTDVDSPLLQVASNSDDVCETITYAVSNECESTDTHLTLISLHKLCILLI